MSTNLYCMHVLFQTLFLASLACMAMAAPQFNGDPSMAKIIQEQRFNMGDGRFGHAAAQEDGVLIKEESAGGNNRVGEYQYIGDDGKTYTVKYEASHFIWEKASIFNIAFTRRRITLRKMVVYLIKNILNVLKPERWNV